MSGEELKAADCPFCGAEMEPLNLGGSDHLSDFIHPGTVTDKQCLLSGQGFTGDQLAAWNRRHPLPEQPQEGEWEAIEARAWDWLQETFGAVKPAVELDYAPHQMVEAFHAGHAAHSPMSELQRMGEEFEAGAPNLDSYIAGREDEAEMRGWQLIETAPKGGGQFLAWHSADGICLVWNAETYWLYRGQNNLPGGLVDQAAACTHWLPLPAAPSSESKL